MMDLLTSNSAIVALVLTILAGVIAWWGKKQSGMAKFFAELLSDALEDGATAVKKLGDNKKAVKYFEKKGFITPPPSKEKNEENQSEPPLL